MGPGQHCFCEFLRHQCMGLDCKHRVYLGGWYLHCDWLQVDAGTNNNLYLDSTLYWGPVLPLASDNFSITTGKKSDKGLSIIMSLQHWHRLGSTILWVFLKSHQFIALPASFCVSLTDSVWQAERGWGRVKDWCMRQTHVKTHIWGTCKHRHTLSSITPYCLQAPRVEPSPLSLSLPPLPECRCSVGRRAEECVRAMCQIPRLWESAALCWTPSSLPLSLPPCLPPSLSHFAGPLSRRAPCPAPTPCECVRMWVCARVPACLSAHRKWAESVCQRSSAWNCRFLQTVSMPTTKPLHNTHIHTHTQATSSAPCQEQPRRPEKGGRLLLPSLSLYVYLCIPSPSLCLFLLSINTDIFSPLCVHCFHCFEDPELQPHSESFFFFSLSDACQQAR